MRIEFQNYEDMYDTVYRFKDTEACKYIPEGKHIRSLELANNGDYRNDVFGFRIVLTHKNVSIRFGQMFSFRDGKWDEETPEDIVAIYELDEKEPRNAIEAYANIHLSAFINAFPDVEPEDGNMETVGFIDTEEIEYE